MPLRLDVSGRPPLELRFLLLDVNGTLSNRGRLLDGVAEALEALRPTLEPWLLSADSFGTLATIAERLALPARRAPRGEDKLALLRELGASHCVSMGNGANDAAMLAASGLGMAVIGPEGASGSALAAADVVCRSPIEALALLREPRALAATLHL